VTYTVGSLFISGITASDSEVDTTFESGDVLGLSSPIGPDEVVFFFGSNGDGFIAQGTVTSNYYFFSNEVFNNGDIVTITHGGTFVVCFLTGTLIATPTGERAVETLEVGDTVLTADGATRTVRWLGRQSVLSRFANPVRNYPIRIAAGALGARLPRRDLFLSPDHALLLDDVLVHASALVNGSSIARVMDPGERFTYWHIETEDHTLVLAEGCAAETFVDNVARRRFDNYGEYEALYGNENTVPELDLPRAMSVRQVPRAIRERLAAIALGLGYDAKAVA
jgi:hypothetical protein